MSHNLLGLCKLQDPKCPFSTPSAQDRRGRSGTRWPPGRRTPGRAPGKKDPRFRGGPVTCSAGLRDPDLPRAGADHTPLLCVYGPNSQATATGAPHSPSPGIHLRTGRTTDFSSAPVPRRFLNTLTPHRLVLLSVARHDSAGSPGYIVSADPALWPRAIASVDTPGRRPLRLPGLGFGCTGSTPAKFNPGSPAVLGAPGDPAPMSGL